ncbi:hypothetical protein MPL3356_110109 [Mesorhizobium plurifarium]|uniref:Uncharacterized protein n=1 Tax=Mesorhizobium plurifarium TaxID=69974 RepID=A0A090DF48_MESPL|nr:hypothetical protein MPL3356_110109 [Mesorhizobium plurifarium]
MIDREPDRGTGWPRGGRDVNGSRAVCLGQLPDGCRERRPCSRGTGLAETPEAELEELTQIYVDRGLDRELAERVAVQPTERDALGTHAREFDGSAGGLTFCLGHGGVPREGIG